MEKKIDIYMTHKTLRSVAIATINLDYMGSGRCKNFLQTVGGAVGEI